MASAPPAAPDAILWCSWCFKRSPMVMVDRRFFGRNLLRCTLCWRYGASCFKCSDGAARSQLDGETIDKLCACCQDAVRAWGEAPRFEEVSPTGWCSHCLKKASFTLTQKNFVARNDYECDTCHRGACFCVNCGEAYTRGTAALCVKCEGSIGKWEDYETNMKALLHGPAWCSWCIEFTAHRREESNAIRRHVFHCTSCRQRTLPCTTCEDGMAEGGPAWDDDLCERCRGRIVHWEDARRRKEAILAQVRTKEQVMADMMRDSPERQRAVREGLLRPFLLLVSMSPVLRATAAAALGWNMLLTPSFGSPHQEAYSLLFEPRMGIQARAMGMMEKFASASHLVAWEGILRRTQQAVWHTLPDRRGEAEAEEALLLEVARTAMQRLTPDQRRAIEERGEKQHTAELLRDASEAVMTRAELRTYAFEVCAAVLLSPENAVSAAATVAPVLMPMALGVTAVLSALAGPLALLGLGSLLYQGAKLVWGSSEPRLLVPLILALNQRIMLAAQGVHWTDALARTNAAAPPPSLAPAAAAPPSLAPAVADVAPPQP